VPIPFNSRVQVPADVLVSQLEGESVILNLKTESYFGLDDVGARMWTVVTASRSIQAGYVRLTEEYSVDPERLREDLATLLEQLVEQGLLQIQV
jgi:Coenzyme PQQ synthesis protein D (PqqD)